MSLPSCSSDAGPSSDAAAPVGKVGASTVGPAGGAVTTSVGVRIDIPPGALTTEVEITITGLGAIAPPEGTEAIRGGYLFEPEGLTFLLPVKVTLPVAGPYPQEKRVAVGRQVAGGEWTLLEGAVTDTSVTVETLGFSRWLAVLVGGGAAQSKRSAEHVIWTRQFGLGSSDEVSALAVGPDDGAVVAGITWGAFPGFEQGGNGDAFVRRYDANGQETWTRQFGAGSTEHAKAVATSAAGTIYVAGQALHFLGDETDPERRGGGFVRTYGADGDLKGSFQLKTAGYGSEVTAIAVSGNDLVIAGQQGTERADPDLFVRKIDGAGNTIWGDVLNGQKAGENDNSSDSACGVGVDGEGNAVLLGQLNGPLAGVSGRGGVVVRKYAPGGAALWTKVFEDEGCAVNSGSLRVAADGHVYLAAGTEVRKLGPSGDVLWQKSVDPLHHGLSTIALAPDAVLVAGFTRDVPAAEGDSWDVFVRRYGLDGAEGWTRQLGSPGQDNPYALDVDGAGRIYLGGRSITMSGSLPGVTEPGTGAFLMQLQP
ncbi:MAG: SBBP repeat-containing protein [Labilithrix sp.]|nr:SBBP repeat-containing protein [Labilithrix sp.]MCW5816965.1 SBBP repeat-containing protein [Labilithrix sp.]